MTNHQKSADLNAAIEELRRLARERFETAPELVKLRQRIASERQRTHDSILQRVAEQAHVDLQPIFDEVQRRKAAKRRYVTRTLERLQAQASESAKAQKERFHRIRADYVQTFPAAPATAPQLKFRQPIDWASAAQPGECNNILGGPSWSPPNEGNYEASADIVPQDVGVWLYPFISTDTRDCDDTRAAETIQDLTYQMGPPAQSFAVSTTRVDLIGNGVATSHFGDPGCLESVSNLYVHSFVDLDIYVAQQVNGEWQQWPLVSDRLFVGQGEYVKQIRLLLSGAPYPSSIVLRSPAVGGGDLLCYLQVVCSSLPAGTDGRVGIDFAAPAHGMFVGGVALLGDFV